MCRCEDGGENEHLTYKVHFLSLQRLLIVVLSGREVHASLCGGCN